MMAREYACEFEVAIPPEFETRDVSGLDADADTDAADTPGLDVQQADCESTFRQGALSMLAVIGRDRDDDDDDDDDSDFEFDDFDDEPDDEDVDDDFDDDDDVDEDFDESDEL